MVMGGLLCEREMQRRDWEQVLDDSEWSMTGMPEYLYRSIYLSYEDMPPYLKQCFLYCCLLPKSNRFDVLHVVGMWIGEGIIYGNSDDLEELGRSYFKELISRNLIEQDEFDFEHSYCSMNDVVRSFGQYMARDEALVAQNEEIDTFEKLNSKKFLRLSIELGTNQLQFGELYWRSLQRQKSVRTLISTIQIKMYPGYSFANFSSLRTLYIVSADVDLFESLHHLKHLRYLKLVNTTISALPWNIGKMKLLQYLDLEQCGNLMNLPDSIVKLGQLRYLNLPRDVSMIPRGFRGLTNMRILGGFPALVNVDDWCSLDELGALSQLRVLRLVQLEDVSNAATARLCEKMHLRELLLSCSSRRRLGHDGLVKEKESISEEDQRQIEKVFNQLCPPPSVKYLYIEGYFAKQLPRWIMSMSTVPLHNLKFLTMNDLACCTQLPDGLCELPSLLVLQVDRAPCIRCVGTKFLRHSQATAAAFPRLNKMILNGMVEWEEWEWELEEQVEAMPVLEELRLQRCKLRRIPSGLTSHARALRRLLITSARYLSYLENFASVVVLDVCFSPDLERVSNLRRLQKLTVVLCPKLKVVKDVPELHKLVLEDYGMETLPEYMRDITPRHLEIECSIGLLTSIAAGQSGHEWEKFSHVQHVKAYAHDGDNRRKWYVFYTRNPYYLEANVSPSFMSGGTLSIFEDEQIFESVLNMSSRTFNYICSLMKEPSLGHMKSYTFLDGIFLRLEDQVAIALMVLKSGESPATIVPSICRRNGSSICIDESTVSLVTERFVDAMLMGRWHHSRWPGTDEMEKVKSKFGKTHSLPNCCGVVHTTRIPFVYQNSDHAKNDNVLLQVVVDSNMRFINVELGWSGNEDQLSILQDSMLFRFCGDGRWMNGSKLKVSPDGSKEVGEYIIGDAGYSLLPWLLTPYQPEKDLSDFKVEFNKRHFEATAVTLKALTRLKDTWKCLHGGTWRPDSPYTMCRAIYLCCMLHNIVIDMEDGAGMPSSHKVNRKTQVRDVAAEDAVRARDILSKYLTSKSSESRCPRSLVTNIRNHSSLMAAIGEGEYMHVGKHEDELVGAHSSSRSAGSVFSEYGHEPVGIHSPQEHLIKMLHLEDTQLKMVSICGTGGLGKTTIAKAVCRKIETEFDSRAFVSVSREPNIKEIIRGISDQVGNNCHDNEESDVQQLGNSLSKFLEGKRYLIVFDDVWDVLVWNKILDALKGTSNNHGSDVNNNNGSRIIVTTRKVDVAENVGGLYHLPLLSDNDSRLLFYGRTCFGSEDNCPSQFREISKRMLSKCGQLPLAIIFIADLLPERSELQEWQNVCSSIEMGQNMENIRRVLRHSYDDLHADVKPCLLFLSVFPEGHEFTRDGLVRRWIAENLIRRKDGQNLQELGERYFSELVNSSLIEPIEFDSFGKDQAYHVHITALDLIVSLSIEQDSVTILPGLQRIQLRDEVQRLSLQVSNEKHDVLKSTKKVGQVSSLSVFSGADLIQSVSKFQGLHVLDLQKCDSFKDEHLNGLKNLNELRYLALGGSHITVVPQKIWKLKHLQTLDLTATSVTQLPSSIAKLTQLRRLLINRSTKVPDKIIGKLQALEELLEIDISESPNVLQEISIMPELRVLSIALWSWDEHHSRLLSEALCNLRTKKLKRISIYTCCLLDLKPEMQPVLQQLEELEIQGSTFNTLPNLIGLLTHLRSLSIEVYSLENSALQILGKLPHLIFLSLDAKRTAGEELVVVSDKFSSLKTVLLSNHAMAIKFEQGAMERLERLKLTLQASVTKYFWFGLENLSSLKRVQVEIICFSATDGVVYKAKAAIESMIGENPNNPTLEITRTVEKYKIEKKRREADCEMKEKDEDQEAGEAKQKNRVPVPSRRAEEEQGRGTRGSIEDDLIYLT